MQPRKIVLIKDIVSADGGRETAQPVTRVVAAAIVTNPCAGRFVDDLAPMFDIGAELGERLAPEMAAILPRPAVAYGKGAIVGVNGEIEHAAALLHPKLGKPMRAAIGGGEAIIPSTSKVAAAGATIDVPLGHKDNVWSFDEIDTITVCIPDAPRPDEIVLILAFSDGGRPHPRVGKGKI